MFKIFTRSPSEVCKTISTRQMTRKISLFLINGQGLRRTWLPLVSHIYSCVSQEYVQLQHYVARTQTEQRKNSYSKIRIQILRHKVVNLINQNNTSSTKIKPYVLRQTRANYMATADNSLVREISTNKNTKNDYHKTKANIL